MLIPFTKRPMPGPSEAYLFLLFLVNLWGMGLALLLAPLTGALVKDLALAGGDVTVSWFIAVFLGLNALFTPVWVYIGERTSRHRALTAATLCWTVCALAIRMTDDALSFGVLWALAGIADAALLPLTCSLAVDLVPPERRGRALGLLATIGVLSGGLVMLLGGLLVDHYGWRAPFLVVGLLGLALTGLLVALSRHEPRRGAMETELQALFSAGRAYERRFRLRDVSLLLNPLSNLWIVLASLLATLPVNVISGWLIRMLQTDHGFSTSRATFFTLLIFTSQVPGAMLLGRLGDRVGATRIDGKARLIGRLFLVALPLYVAAFLMPFGGDDRLSWGLVLFAALMGAAAFVTSGPPPLVLNLIGDINRPEARGAVFALIGITRVVARGGGGLLLTYTAARWFDGRLSPALALLSLCLLPAALLMVPVRRTAGRDHARVEAHLREYVASRREG